MCGCQVSKQGAASAEEEEYKEPEVINVPEESEKLESPNQVDYELPKLQLVEQRPKALNKKQRDLLTEEPETLNTDPEQKNQRIDANSPGELSNSQNEQEQPEEVQPRRVKKIIKSKKQSVDYEFNVNVEAQNVAEKDKDVFDQLEREELEVIKQMALKRPGSAGNK